MSLSIGTDVQKAYEAIKSGELGWAVFAYEGQQDLKVQATGEPDDYDDFVDEFSDGRLQYAFLKVQEPNSKLPKFVLVGWCGDGAPRKGVFQQHFASVASKLTGYHVQITARDSDDVALQEIEKKVADASGAKYSVSQTSGVFGAPTAHKKTNSLVSQLKQQNSGGAAAATKSTTSSVPLVSARKPLAQTAPRLPPTAPAVSSKPSATRTASTRQVEDWDTPEKKKAEPVKLPGLNKAHDGKDTQEDGSDAPVKSSYQPIGRPDIAALRAQASDDSSKPTRGATGTAYSPAEVPKTGALADRMSAFTNNNSTSSNNDSSPSGGRPRNTSNPLASRFGKPSFGTKPAVPAPVNTGSKALGGLSKNYGTEGGKTPAQLWQERKARERGETVPDAIERAAPVKATRYGAQGDDEEADSVQGLREKFAGASVKEDEKERRAPVSVPMPVPVRAPVPARSPSPEPEEPEEEAAAPPPPPPMNTRPAAAVLPPRAPSPAPEPEPEPESEPEPEQEPETAASDEQEEEKQVAQPSFKDQLAAKIGGGPTAPGTAAASTSAAPHAAKTSGKPQARVVYDYDAAEEGEISLAEGAVVTDIDQVDEGWWSGTNEQGESGLFPANYVEIVEDQAEDHQEAASPAASGGARADSAAKGQCAVAEYSYEVGEEGEVGFEEGEEITHIEQVDPGWWEGVNVRGEKGLFPSSYVRLL